MEKYKNLSGNSGVESFEIGEDFIRIKFQKVEAPYIYNHQNPGRKKVEKMKVLAQTGKGLSTYISQEVKDSYYSNV